MSPRIREVSRNFEDMGRVEEKERSRRVEDGRGRGGSDIYSEYRPSLSRSSSTVSDEGIIIGNICLSKVRRIQEFVHVDILESLWKS